MTHRRVAWIIALAFTVLTVRLAMFVERYAVNLIYLDQWDFLNGLFEGADWWTLFRVQHGPQRQGLGNLISAVVLGLSGWNGKVDAAVSAVTMAVAGLAALWLVKRLCGRLRPWDVVVPLLFLTTTPVQTYIVTPNLAHGPLPVLFLMAYGLALTVESHVQRSVLITGINFLAVNTGFTVLLGGITPVALLLLALQPGLRRLDRAAYAIACAASVATAALFLHGFEFVTAVDCYRFPHERPWEYVSFVGRMLARPFGVPASLLHGEFLSTAIALGAAGLTAYAVVRILRGRGGSALWNVIGLFMLFTLAFAATTAVGRICIGMAAAESSRYIPYLVPGIFAVYLMLRGGLAPGPTQSLLLALFLIACIAKERTDRIKAEAGSESDAKRTWHDCYLRRHDIAACNAEAPRGVYPAPEATRLQQKLDWLEARGYNLFQDK